MCPHSRRAIPRPGLYTPDLTFDSINATEVYSARYNVRHDASYSHSNAGQCRLQTSSLQLVVGEKDFCLRPGWTRRTYGSKPNF